MKTKKTTFVAVLSQTRTRSATTISRYAHASQDTAVVMTGGSSQAGLHWCGECATPMVMMPPEQASTVCLQTTRTIYRLVEAGRIHFTDGPEGVMVCPASLMKNWAGEEMPLLA
jgi:hypothetical protein